MISNDPSEYLWVQKFRPRKISECILPEELSKTFQAMSEQERLPALLLTGGPGTGKTTVAKALCDEVGAEWLMINGSEEGRSIDTLRTKIKTFASTISMTSSKKVVIIDEADYMNADSIQPALRGFAEEFSKNCTFILTCNYKNRIIAPLQSRFTPVDFKIPASEKSQLGAKIFKRMMEILDVEGIQYDKKVVAAVVQKYFPDFRRMLNELQRYSASGVIDTGILVNLSEESFNKLIVALKEKKYSDVRQWTAANVDTDSVKLFSDLYAASSKVLEPKSIPELVLILAKYQYQAAFVADHELNTMAALTEIMMGCSFQ